MCAYLALTIIANTIVQVDAPDSTHFMARRNYFKNGRQDLREGCSLGAHQRCRVGQNSVSKADFHSVGQGT